MQKTLTTFVKGLKTALLVALYNLAQDPETWKGNGKPSATVKKFTDRATAEKRLIKLMTGWDDAANAFAGYNEFYADFAHKAKKLSIDLPTPEEDKPEAKKGKMPRKTDGQSKTPPHLNLRCPSCGYYAKTIPTMLAKARLICPVDPKHGKLLTADERGEKRGR